MPNLTAKELNALSDQLDFERVLHCKYRSAAQECQDLDLQSKFLGCAQTHLNNYNTLLGHLR